MALVDSLEASDARPEILAKGRAAGFCLVNPVGSCQGVNGGVALPPVSNVVVSGRLIGCAFDDSGGCSLPSNPWRVGPPRWAATLPSHTCSGVAETSKGPKQGASTTRNRTFAQRTPKVMGRVRVICESDLVPR